MNSKKKENGPKYQYGMSGTDGGYTGTGTTSGNGRGSESRWGEKALDQYDAESNPDYCNHTGWSSNRLTVGAGEVLERSLH